MRRDCLAPDEATRLVQLHSETQARFIRGVHRGEIEPVLAIGALRTEVFQGVISGLAQVECLAGFTQGVENTLREFGRYMQLPSQLADICQAVGDRSPISNVYLLRRRERKRTVGEIGVGDPTNKSRDVGPCTDNTE